MLMGSIRAPWAPPVVLVLLAISACDRSVTGNERHARVESTVVTPADDPPHTSIVVTLDRPAGVQVTYWRASDGAALQVVSAGAAATHDVFLPRTHASSAYLFEVRSVDTDGDLGPAVRGSFNTEALPDEVAGLQFAATGAPTDSLAIVEVMISETGFGGGVIIVDAQGRVVWYWKGSGGFLMGSSRRANGNWVFHNDGRIVEVTPDRRTVRTVPVTSATTPYGAIHHDLAVTPRNTVYFIANDSRTYPDSTVVGEAIWEWFPEENRFEKKWSAFDFLAWPADRGPDSDKANWMHMNSLAIGSRGNILFSSRSLDQVVSIAPDFRSLEWRLGGINATIPVTGDAHFSGQHNISEVGPNRILMWDNGRRRTLGQFSRGLELLVDPISRTASKVAEFRANPDRLQPIVGGAYRLQSGNTLITYGWGGGEQINIYEIDATGSERWHLQAPSVIGRIYKARTLQSIVGERTVPKP